MRVLIQARFLSDFPAQEMAFPARFEKSGPISCQRCRLSVPKSADIQLAAILVVFQLFDDSKSGLPDLTNPTEGIAWTIRRSTGTSVKRWNCCFDHASQKMNFYKGFFLLSSKKAKLMGFQPTSINELRVISDG
uniref:hypothetical protein n=1 Tax=Paenisporosarcina antarctica TaxID=417367 RepID=UPI001FB964D2|nr:hypothetical protein [Paenisporosarcina antarctica]